MDVEELVKSNMRLSVTILKFETNLRKTAKARITKGFLEARTFMVEGYWSTFSDTHIRLMNQLEETDESTVDYCVNNTYDTIEEAVMNIKTYINEKMEELKPNQVAVPAASVVQNEAVNATNTPKTPEIKLPTINIPKFDGNYRTWSSFYDLFKSLIHDSKTIATVHKLHYLKSSVTGEAERVIRHFQITALNYTPAWEMLIQRYDNKRILVNSHIKSLFNQPRMNQDSAFNIKNLLNSTLECIHSVRNLGVETSNWDVLLNYMVVQKLTPETHVLWEQNLENSRELPTFQQLQDFLEARYRTLEMISSKPVVQSNHQNNQNRTHQAFHGVASSSSNDYKCPLCNGAHSVRKCQQFQQMSTFLRSKTATSKGWCTNCLSSKHHTSQCPSSQRCLKCKKKHHTLLHFNTNNSSTNNESTANNSASTNNSTVNPEANQQDQSRASTSSSSTENINSFHINHHQNYSAVLLATALVRVQSYSGNEFLLRALLDQGSQASFMTESACQRLQLKRERTLVKINGIGDGQTTSNYQASLILNAHFQQKLNLNINALVLRSLTQLLPSRNVREQSWDHVKDLKLADPQFATSSKIDLILGADVYSQILLDGVRHGPTGTPIAQRTQLGWILSGPTAEPKESTSCNINVVCLSSCISLDDQLKKFWELEEVQPTRTMTKDELRCEEIFEKTFKRDKNGRCIVKLPFIDAYGKEKVLGGSKSVALQRFKHTERSFQTRHTSYKMQYSSCLQEYIHLNHMELVPPQELKISNDSTTNTPTATGCYLPHHGVMKESSTSTKLRVVFDASQPTQSGLSLNNVLHTGPRLQDDLTSIVSRWRKFRYAVTADIEKMYRQVKVYQEDADYQRILWRTSTDSDIETYRLLTLTFGTSAAPYLAIKCLQQCAKLYQSKYPLAHNAIYQNFFVDDLLSGAGEMPEAIKMQRQLVELLRNVGFELRKWMSNAPEILEQIPPEHRETASSLNLDQESSVKTLGLYWHPITDTFQFKLSLSPIPTKLSKRIISSEIAKLFDPNGWLAPVTIKAKIILQSLWLTGLDWDDNLPSSIIDNWVSYRNELNIIETLAIPRWIGTTDKYKSIQFHCFCDASTHAYASVIYVRQENEDGTISNHLLNAKTKVAPIKPVTLARLELCAAVLGARLLQRTMLDMQIPDAELYAWTDSTIVLAWLQGHPHKWTTFVANRVGEIHLIIPNSSWNHISGVENPADCASRGIAPNAIINHPLWWHGPTWLSKNKTNWPISKIIETTTLEQKSTETIQSHNVITEIDSTNLLHKYSSLIRLQRITAYCFRFIRNLKPKSYKQHSSLTIIELNDALIFWIQKVQEIEFREDQKRLKQNKPLANNSKLLPLNPFIDNAGTLRVGGRLQNANLQYDNKHQIILPKQHHLTTLVIDYYHQQTLHGGPQLTMNATRAKYWIMDARNSVRHRIHHCLVCYRHRAITHSQLMGQLPSVRVTAARPFQHTGVDYAGPLEIKWNKGRGSKTYKAYISLFVCLAVKSIHLEIVTDLTTTGFMAAYKRFVARRGLCSIIYSDNGTNFVGAAGQLRRDFNRANIEAQMAKITANDATEWRFIPAASPNFGGLWEAGVKSVKNHLKRTLGNSRFTYEELNTCLIQIEAALNSRPLCPLSTNPNDLEALTPGHFLIGQPLLAPPEPDLLDLSTNRLTRWQEIQQKYQSFWKRWYLEYISNLQQRPKWQTKNRNVKIDDLVLIKDDRLPPQKWLLGRIVHITPGTDGLVRVVDIKTTNGITSRSISKIAILPLDSSDTTTT